MLFGKSKNILLVLLFFLLIGCSSERTLHIKKYWNAGSERPYIINKVLYYPQVHYNYDKIGYASWYGYDFHGKPTATGRIFNKNAMTAAHRTLPLPCVVLVENLENHRKVRLLVNDRGPFVKIHKRIIDVSQRAAQTLGFRRKGITKVRVTCLKEESKKAARRYGRKPYR